MLLGDDRSPSPDGSPYTSCGRSAPTPTVKRISSDFELPDCLDTAFVCVCGHVQLSSHYSRNRASLAVIRYPSLARRPLSGRRAPLLQSDCPVLAVLLLPPVWLLTRAPIASVGGGSLAHWRRLQVSKPAPFHSPSLAALAPRLCCSTSPRCRSLGRRTRRPRLTSLVNFKRNGGSATVLGGPRRQ